MEKQQCDKETARKNAEKRAQLRQAQLENLRTLQGLREEMKPQDWKNQPKPVTKGSNDEGRFKSLASGLVAVKKVENATILRESSRRSSLDLGEFYSNRDLQYHDDERSVYSSAEEDSEQEEESDEEEEPQMFSATIAAMKLVSSSAQNEDQFRATLNALKLNELASGEDWYTGGADESSETASVCGYVVSMDEYESRRTRIEELEPTYRGSKSDNIDNNDFDLKELVPTKLGNERATKSQSLWEDETNHEMNYDEDENAYESSNENENSYESSHENYKVEAGDENSCTELDFRPTPLPLNPLREDSEASMDGMMMVPASNDLHTNVDPKPNFLKNHGKTLSGSTNRTKSTNTIISSNDSEVDSVAPLNIGKPSSKMSQIKNSLRSSFRDARSGGSVTSAVSELTPSSLRHHSSSQSVGTSSSSKWRRRLSGLTNGANSNKHSDEVPPQYVEATKAKDRRRDLQNGKYIGESMTSDLTSGSSARYVVKGSFHGDESGRSGSSTFNQFFDDRSHTNALSEAISVNSSVTRQNSINIKHLYHFPNHEYPLIRIQPYKIFPGSPGWECDSCSMETTNMKTTAYVSTNQNFIVCRHCFASLGSIEIS